MYVGTYLASPTAVLTYFLQIATQLVVLLLASPVFFHLIMKGIYILNAQDMVLQIKNGVPLQ